MAGRGKSKGYTTLFRELGTPEGEFHATFATKNRKLRRAARRLARAYPDDPVIQRFVDTLEQDRHELWEAWKRGALSPEMQRIVASVRIPHHGPKVGADIPPERREPPIDQPRLPGLRAAGRRVR
jgi:hypothetical protein